MSLNIFILFYSLFLETPLNTQRGPSLEDIVLDSDTADYDEFLKE